VTNIFILSSRISALEKTLVSKDNSKTVRHHGKLALKLNGNGEIENISSSLQEHSPSKTLERKCKTAEKKIFELQKVLEFKVEAIFACLSLVVLRNGRKLHLECIFSFLFLKQNELDAVNGAHSNRLQRYKNLQHEHKIVLEQLKTFENLR
jgi:3-methyladenine DNA glycosylase/8-oxoguanine DNA glycosylase